MTAVPTTQIHTVVDDDGSQVPAGTAYLTERRGVVTVVFDYAASYLAERHSYPLSPDLSLSAGRHSVSGLPGCFADSAPDRWGRNLIAKRLRSEAHRDGQHVTTIREVDYLLGVSDVARQGALRFALTEHGPYLDDEPSVPKVVALPRLLDAADAVDNDDMAAVKELLDAGSASLGGARPKASVKEGADLLIAKFPHRSDEWDVMAWEKTALDLAERCGIRVPARRLVDVGGRAVLVLDRFDRSGTARIGYVSAMTLLRVTDSQQVDYLELAEAVGEHGSNVAGDLAELWRRIALSLVVNNTDDHLRNHGFLREPGGWRLSPAFDVNPNPDPGSGRATSIGFVSDAEGGRAELMRSAPYFGLDTSTAASAWADILDATTSWREVAVTNGVAKSHCELFAPVFDRFR